MADTKKLLVVANSETFLRMLRFYFTKAGYDVQTVSDGDEALRYVTAEIPDALVTDESLSGMDALQLVRQLRASPVTAQLPVLVLVAGGGGDVRVQAAIGAGATEAMRRDARIQDIGEMVAGLVAAGAAAAPPLGSIDGRSLETGRLAHTVTLLSARGGSGKSLLATNLGVALAQRQGETTVLLDLNLEFGATAMMLDLRPVYTLRDIADAVMSDVSDTEFDGMLLRHSSGLRVVPAVAQPGDSELIPDGALPRIVDRLRRLYDHVVVDGRPSFREFMLDLWENSDTLLIMCPPEVVSVLITRSLLEAFGVINISPEKVLIVLNNVAPKARLNSSQVERGLGSPTFTVPYGGEQLYRSVDVGKSFVLEAPREPFSVAIRKLADLLVTRARDRVGTS
ncbi:MAG TPA: response regulator [Candidatus Dormibacteraeota bacterium]|nr:response regulator [Candidatus Dormibacteraeota bacterium]